MSRRSKGGISTVLVHDQEQQAVACMSCLCMSSHNRPGVK